jgi:tRNA modification GTPase
VVIAGPPNAGKSSLMNAILKSDRAIVTEVPGTTRDVLAERLRYRGLEITLMDTAGLREAEDAVEREGVLRARRAAESADVVLLVLDGSAPESGGKGTDSSADERAWWWLNKCVSGAFPAGRAAAFYRRGRRGLERLPSRRGAGGGQSAAEELLTLTQPGRSTCPPGACGSSERQSPLRRHAAGRDQRGPDGA